MSYYPIFLDLSAKNCLVVGGGRVAERKVVFLLKSGARVTVWSPQMTAKLAQLVERKVIIHRSAPYRRGALRNYHLVIVATDDPRLQKAISHEAQRARVLANIVDQPGLCDFIAPSVVTRGGLTIAISTGGASPAMAKRIRRQLEVLFGREYAIALEVLSRIRERLPADIKTATERQRLLRRVAASSMIESLRKKRFGDVDRILKETLGPDYTMKNLGMRAGG